MIWSGADFVWGRFDLLPIAFYFFPKSYLPSNADITKPKIYYIFFKKKKTYKHNNNNEKLRPNRLKISLEHDTIQWSWILNKWIKREIYHC